MLTASILLVALVQSLPNGHLPTRSWSESAGTIDSTVVSLSDRSIPTGLAAIDLRALEQFRDGESEIHEYRSNELGWTSVVQEPDFQTNQGATAAGNSALVRGLPTLVGLKVRLQI